MAIFRIFKMAAAAILNFEKFKIIRSQGSKGSNCVNVPNFVAIGQTFAEIWRFSDFIMMAEVRHLVFLMRVFGPHTKGT